MAFAPGTGEASALLCEGTQTQRAESFDGEVSGDRSFTLETDRGWTFMLARERSGWRLHLLDKEGHDLAGETPPARGRINPRHLYGWHFRNADNSGPNRGDVNAPQRERLFTIALNDGEGSGFGWLKLLDFGLADLEPGSLARMVYLRFVVCLVYPMTPDEIEAEAFAAASVYLPEEEERMRACGLPAVWRLEAWLLPRWLEGDMDEDGAIDFMVPVSDVGGEARALAICRAGTWLSILDEDRVAQTLGIPASYLRQVEAWRLEPFSETPIYAGKEAHPDADGDVLLLERVEKSAYALFWRNNGLQAHRLYP
ncbi:MAG: hypothetical protein CVT81_02070 [Alphaproteobacteria bacterium HGW-Alphaproteobacteria-3]|nr:MAG: hypothetical protein CVT81_02070 [Alphaproteobacteria bacterium HGW-Alphaproteobacteria-3]